MRMGRPGSRRDGHYPRIASPGDEQSVSFVWSLDRAVDAVSSRIDL